MDMDDNPQKKFVIHHHTRKDKPEHWDLMLEKGEYLETYQISELPVKILSSPVKLTKIFNHEKKFLTYQGLVNNGLGEVSFYDSGVYSIESAGNDNYILSLHGKKIYAEFSLKKTQDEIWELKPQ